MSAPQSGSTPPGAHPYRAPPPRKRPAWRSALWAGAAIVVFIGVAWLATPHDGGGQSGPGGPGGAGSRGGRGAAGGPGGGRRPPTVVGVATAQKGDIPIELTELGTVTPLASVTVTPRIAGNLMRVDFKEGQMVKAGQLLALIDDRPYVAALTQAEGQLMKDQAALANARLDLTRYTTLAKQDSIAQQQVDTQSALVKQDEGVVKTDQAAVASARLNVEYCHITSPVSGRVGLRQVDPGNYVTSSATNGIVIVTEIDPMDVVFTLPEDSAPQVMARMRSGATLAATALDRAGAQTVAQGQLLTLDNQIDTSTGTVKAKARFANGTGALYPNQFVNIRLLVDTIHDAIVVPTQAVRHGSQGDYVYTVDLDQNAKMTPVKVGQINGEKTQILSGVQAGDEVVTDGGDRLRDGAPVILPADVPAMQKANKPPEKQGFWAWLTGLFGHKPAAGEQAAAGSGRSSGAGQAASSGAGAPGGGRGGARFQAMMDQLDLTPDQKEKIRPILSDMRQKAMAAGPDPEARRAAMKEAMPKIEAILTPEQKTKFEALRAQMRGGGGQGAGAQQ
ncbi:MdtA/MuxA family multidrug efflux RND transporter periplasmic adaptor subunit [Phenylobacterium montanum]|uniref:MdtA/MuxA family multidrug efflux RND transporter periplasmic adaptor subunit n=1 Tax=Phenylobacterium montanum TaxID=2823693 RepID=A0A975FYG8_9CAUL|nr:MdtA/MuxA family multidrug efflux RND transporter periplasmic adaptor subunit [Caulobacter sp. S6]QUD86621.1 MdtA/MuxA family multidrug efflux RND transporter periplasmic adaptor subunit [Caulobacter sp. S6]